MIDPQPYLKGNLYNYILLRMGPMGNLIGNLTSNLIGLPSGVSIGAT